MTARILENYNLRLILEFLLDMHRAEKSGDPLLLLEAYWTYKFKARYPICLLYHMYLPQIRTLDMLCQPIDEYFNPPGIRQNPIPNVAQDPVIPTGPSVSIAIDLNAPSGSHTSSPLDHHSSSVHHGLAGEPSAEVNPFAAADPEPLVNVFAPDYNSEAS
ncbi:hypothetical protein Tco_0115505 [Tanacetum coccineum]